MSKIFHLRASPVLIQGQRRFSSFLFVIFPLNCEVFNPDLPPITYIFIQAMLHT